MEANQRITDDVKAAHKKTFELSLVISLLLVISVLYAMPDIHFLDHPGEIKLAEFEVEDVPRTTEFRRPPPPMEPHVPVPTETDLLPEDAIVIPIDLEFSLMEIPPAPVAPSLYDEFTFIAHELPPIPLAGYLAIQKRIIYPPEALSNAIEGKVVLGILINEDGRSEKITILQKAKQDVGFEAAAIRAIKDLKWKPAQQREKAVKVWVAIPVRFEVDQPNRWAF